ncbi:Glycine/D-amino acid oxidase [Cognatiyoonia koreensis]|uniref:Glycine/D-amino acid oxidase n=1 Tax=Cognatiyoonia koreensis TaxID=364200 RepID=A0A1I0Q721_9RHOB|nr:FAD-binding oxidoreductase [Cognatiyoonia koreensis]SEW22617.1 Glycine/D-amino acid oxidase [Cognatiyoonia koreensis]
MAQKIIVLGSGIIGANIAYQLQSGGADVTIIDAGGASATQASFGWINASFFLDHDHFHLRADSIAAYRDLTAALDLPVDWCGCLCFENKGDALDAQAAELRDLGYEFTEIDAKTFAQFAPCVANPPERSLLFAQEGAAESGALANRLLKAALAAGARIARGVSATGFEVVAGKVVGVHTNAGTLQADQVISAIGTGTQSLLNSVGINIPLAQRPAVMLKTQPLPPLFQHILVTEMGEMRQLPDGSLMMPAAISHQRDASETLAHAIDKEADISLARFQALMPDVALRWDAAELAHRPVPADNLPVVGHVMEGLYVACMHSGITLGALMGLLIGAEVLNGPTNPTTKRLAPYRPDRFRT